jgi:hypothetical protein
MSYISYSERLLWLTLFPRQLRALRWLCPPSRRQSARLPPGHARHGWRFVCGCSRRRLWPHGLPASSPDLLHLLDRVIWFLSLSAGGCLLTSRRYCLRLECSEGARELMFSGSFLALHPLCCALWELNIKDSTRSFSARRSYVTPEQVIMPHAFNIQLWRPAH